MLPRIPGTGALLICITTLMFAGSARASVQLPALDVQNFGADTGTGSDGTTLSMHATAYGITTSGGHIDIADQPFLLSAQYVSQSGSSYLFGNGSLSIGSLLSASFSSLSIVSLGGGAGQVSADLSYTGGMLAAGIGAGRIEGILDGASSSDFSQAFTAPTLIAEVGRTAVPIPAAVWMFGSGVLALVSRRGRRKRIAAA